MLVLILMSDSVVCSCLVRLMHHLSSMLDLVALHPQGEYRQMPGLSSALMEIVHLLDGHLCPHSS